MDNLKIFILSYLPANPSPNKRVLIECLVVTFLMILINRNNPSLRLKHFSVPAKLSFSTTSRPPFSQIPAQVTNVSTYEEQNKIRVWLPSPECRGSFVSAQLAKDITFNNSIPYAMIRDGNVDYTTQIRSKFNSEQSTYITLYITTHLSTKLMGIPSGKTYTSLGRFEFIEQIDAFLNVTGKPYIFGKKNRRGHLVSEWRVQLSMNPSTISRDTTLRLSLPLITYDGYIIQFKPWMSLSCITGFQIPIPFKDLGDNSKSCLKSNEALLLGGKAVFGNDSSFQAKNLAQFTARGLFGQAKFGSVIMAINVPQSRSTMQNSEDGIEKMKRNTEYLKSFSTTVRQEMIKIGVWDQFPENGLIIIPACTLGTASRISNEECSLSYRSGQYYNGLMLYTLFSQNFRWSASLDMDEFIYEDSQPREKWGKPLVTSFDRIDETLNNRGYFTLKWFNFLAPSEIGSNLTMKIIEGSQIPITGRNEKQGYDMFRNDCFFQKFDKFGKKLDVTGKSALRCDVGEGFKVHTPVTRKSINGKLLYLERVLNLSGIRVWHARHKSNGLCRYSIML